MRRCTMRAIKELNMHSEYHSAFVFSLQLNINETEMRLICVLFLFLVLRYLKGLSFAAESNQVSKKTCSSVKMRILSDHIELFVFLLVEFGKQELSR